MKLFCVFFLSCITIGKASSLMGEDNGNIFANPNLRGLQAICSDNGKNGGDCSNTPTNCGSGGNAVNCGCVKPFVSLSISLSLSLSSFSYLGYRKNDRLPVEYCYESNTYNQNDCGGCRGGCSGENSCLNLDFYCAEGQGCELSCTAKNSCEGLTLYCPDNQVCKLNCSGRGSCVDAEVRCGKGTVAKNNRQWCELADPTEAGEEAIERFDEGAALFEEFLALSAEAILDDFWNINKQSCNACRGYWSDTQPANCQDKYGKALTECELADPTIDPRNAPVSPVPDPTNAPVSPVPDPTNAPVSPAPKRTNVEVSDCEKMQKEHSVELDKHKDLLEAEREEFLATEAKLNDEISTLKATYSQLENEMTTNIQNLRKQANACCSYDFKTCATWGNESRQTCEALGTMLWLENGPLVGNACLGTDTECTNNTSGCCDGLECQGTDSYRQCKYNIQI